jgi:RNA polymerase sigma factor (sigma-70 family)
MSMAHVTLEPVLDSIRKLARDWTNRDASDADLLTRFVAGRDENAFVGLLERYGRLVWNVCRRVHGNVHDAEDSFQATFFVLARQAGKIRSSGSLAGWLYRLAYRTAMHAKKNAYRRRRREQKVAVPVGQIVSGPSGLHELQAVLDEEVSRLAEKHRAPFVLCCLEGKSKSEAAAELGWKEGTVSSRLAHARSLLQERLTRRGLTLSAVLTAGAVSAGAASAAMPAALLTSTARAALPFALGQSTGIAAGPAAATLANGVLRAMGWHKLRVVGAILLAITSLATGTTVAGYSAFSPEPPTGKRETSQSPDAKKASVAERGQPRVDLYGDPLPEGASARLGSMRWRHNHSGSWSTAFFSPNGKAVATWATNQGTVRLWNAADGKLLREITREDVGIWNPIFSPDGQWLAGLAEGKTRAPGDVINRTLNLLHVATGTTRRLLVTKEEGSGDIRLVAFSPDTRVLAVSTDNGNVYLFDFPGARPLGKVPRATQGATAIAFRADGETLLVLSLQDRKIYHWSTPTGAITRAVDLPDLDNSGKGTYRRFSPDGTSVAFQPENGGPLVLYDTATGKERFRLKGNFSSRRSFCFLSNSQTLFTNLQAEDQNISLWDTKTGELKRRLKIQTEWCDEVDIAPDGKTLLAFDGTPTIRLWDMETGKRLTPRQGHEDMITQMVVTDDSKTLISTSRDGRIFVWDLASTRITRELSPVHDLNHGLALRPGADEVASWMSEGTIRFHNWRTGREALRLDINQFFDKKEPSNEGSRRFLYGLECSPDGGRALIFVGQIPGAPPYA